MAKTLRSRIAAVAVAAVALAGVGTSPAVASTTGTKVAATFTPDNSVVNLAGRVNNLFTLTITGDIAAKTTTDRPTLRVAAAMTSQPAGSAVFTDLYAAGSAPEADLTYADAADTAGTTAISASTHSLGTNSSPSSIVYSGDDDDDIDATTDATLGTIKFTPTHVGTYKFVVWNEVATSGTASLGGTDASLTFTLTVADGVSTITMSAHNSSSTTTGTYGSLVKVTLKDANGNVAALAAGEAVSVDPSGDGTVAYYNNSLTSAAAGAAYSLAAGDFTNGVAYINVTDATEETVVLVATLSSNSAVTTNASIVFRAGDSSTLNTVAPKSGTTGWAGSTDTYTVPLSSSVTYAVTAGTGFATGEYTNVTVKDVSGKITGKTNAFYDVAVVYGGTFSVTASFTATGQTYQVQDDTTSASDATPDDTFTSAAVSFTGLSKVTTNVPSTMRIAPAGTFSAVVTVKDQFSRVYSNGRVVLSVTGRNTVASVSATTNADGQATVSYTDSAASTVAATADVVTITAYDEAGVTQAATVNVTWTAVTVSTVTMTTPTTSDTYAGQTKSDISAGDGAEAGAVSFSVVVKDAAGVVIAGIPVTFAVSGLTGAEILTTAATVYTDSAGKAISYVFSTKAGTATLTATAGGVSKTGTINFAQATATEARKVTVTSSGNVVKAVVTDRFGNTIEGVTLNATRTGGGYFGSGSSSTSGTTDKDGIVEFIVTPGATETEVTVAFTSVTYGQTCAAAGKISCSSTALALTAYTAGDALTDQEGVGASSADAGVNSGTAKVAKAAAADTSALDAVKADVAKLSTTITGIQTAISTLVASVTATLTSMSASINKIMKKLKIK